MKISDFLEKVRADSNNRAAIVCGENETLRNVVTKINSNRIHRIYVVNRDDVPVGVVSLRDLFHVLLAQMQAPSNIAARKAELKKQKAKDKERRRKLHEREADDKREKRALKVLVKEALEDLDDE